MVFIACNWKVWTSARFTPFCVWDCSGLLNGLPWLDALCFYSNARGRVDSRDLRAFHVSAQEKCLLPHACL